MHVNQTMKAAAPAGDAVDRWLARAIRFTALVLVLAIAALGVFWYAQRYVHPTVSVVDRDAQILETQIRAQPSDPQLRVAAANLYLEKGRYDDAIAQAEQVLQASPANLGALLALGQAHAGKGSLDQATGYLSRAIELNRDNPVARASLQFALVHSSLGGIYLQQGRTGEAVDELRKALEIDRSNADTLQLLAGALVTQGQTDEAIHVYRQALRLVPDFTEVYRDLQRIYEQQGDRDRAALALGMLRYGAGEYDQALDALRQAAGALPDMAEAHLGLAMVYEKKGQRAEALEEYRTAASLDAGSIAARQGVGRLGGR